MKYAFFVGCTTRLRIPFVEKLAREVFEKMDVELADLDFSCCPTSRIVKDVSIDTWLNIAARNIALAEKHGLPILSMCTGCTQTLREAQEMLKDKDKMLEINARLAQYGLEYKGSSEVKFYAQVILENLEHIELTRKLDLTIASHPGCHILRPSNILGFDDPENPTKLDDLIRFLGADAADYPKKAFCCGFPIYSVDPDAAAKMMRDKMTTIHADCLTVLCPTCFEYYELRQRQIAGTIGFKPIQVIHYMQLLGLCMGFDPHFDQLKFRDEDLLRKL